ncbi:MAG: hypothetical protein EOP51_20315 [Sphingobacteriales bacterium]|nr:MAG: hypothetical protein EOP51_20315 [Sphingobacteriales bacterium]
MKTIFRLFLLFIPLFLFKTLPAQTWAPFTPPPTTSVLWDVYAANGNSAWAVGNSATVLQWNGTAWQTHSLAPVISQRFGVWAAPGNTAVYVVGTTTGSQIHRYNGTTWSNITADVGWGSGSIRSVWGSAANDVWICGGSGKVFRFNGSTWSAKNAGVPAALSGNRIWGTDANNIWLVGSTGGDNTGVILKWNPGTDAWVTQATGLPAVKAIWGSSPTNMWAAGGNGAAQQGKIFRMSGSSWSDASPADSYASFYHLGGRDASNIWAVGYNGVMYKYNGSNWSVHLSGVATDINAVAAGVSGAGARLWTAGFGDAGVNPLRFAIEGVLPLRWQSFTAQPAGNNVLLKWSTAMEQNTASFVVEHHSGNQQWKQIASLPAAGNSSQPTAYQFIHTAANNGDNYYRIQQLDKDAAFSYSNTVRLQMQKQASQLQLVNNLVDKGLLQINVQSPQYISIYDMQGRQLQRHHVAAGLQSIDISKLAAGRYTLAGAAERIAFIVP